MTLNDINSVNHLLSLTPRQIRELANQLPDCDARDLMFDLARHIMQGASEWSLNFTAEAVIEELEIEL